MSHNLFVLSSELATGPGNTAERNDEISKGDAENVTSKGKRIDKINFHIYMYGIIWFNVLQQGNGVLYLSSLKKRNFSPMTAFQSKKSEKSSPFCTLWTNFQCLRKLITS